MASLSIQNKHPVVTVAGDVLVLSSLCPQIPPDFAHVAPVMPGAAVGPASPRAAAARVAACAGASAASARSPLAAHL